jgi:hypothetical protein
MNCIPQLPIAYCQLIQNHDLIINNLVVKKPVHRIGDGSGAAGLGVYQCAEKSH